MRKKEEKRKGITELLQYFLEGFTGIFLFLMMGIFLFYYHNNYLDIVSAKKSFFQSLAMILLLVTVLFSIPGLLGKWKENHRVRTISAANLFALFFGITVALSCYFSPERMEAFLGTQGRRLGGCFLLLCLAVYFIVSKYYKSRQLLIWTFLLANSILWLLVILNFFGVDLLHMHENLVDYQQTYFMGTMGNININAGYSGVVISLMMAFYYSGREAMTKRCFWAAAVLGMYACFAVRSDSWILAVFGAYMVILSFSMKERETMQKWWMLCLAFFCSSILMKLTVLLDEAAGWGNRCIQELRTQQLLYDALLDEKILLAELALLVLFWIFLRTPGVIFLEKHGNKLLAACMVLIVLGAAAVAFPLEDTFGNNRGYIWKRTLLNVKEYPFWQKLIGYGPNCFLQSMEERYGAEMRGLYSIPFIDAHNEALQFLAVTGIFGVVSYFGIQISLLVSCIKNRAQNMAALIGCVGIVSYMLQGLVNNPQVFTTPLFFLFLGMIQNKMKTKSEKNEGTF